MTSFESEEKELKKLCPCYGLVEYAAQITSTNDVVKERLKNGEKNPILYVAEKQTAGRGTHGRIWENVDEALLLTVGIKAPKKDVSGLTLVLGMAVKDVLAQLNVQTKVKWPNDIYLEGKKVAGILTESVHARKTTFLVIGLGLNIESHTYPAINIKEDRLKIAASIANRFFTLVTTYREQMRQDLESQWVDASFTYNKKVKIRNSEGRWLEGIECGVTPTGALKIKTIEKMHEILIGSLESF